MTDLCIARPIDDYDPKWPAFWAQNPNMPRAVGADATEGGEGNEGGEGSGGGEGGGQEHWSTSVADEGLRNALSGYDDRDAAMKALGYETSDWRASITDEKLKEHAGRFTSIEDVVKGNMTLRSERDQLKSTAVKAPGQDAKPEEVAAFRTAMGIPEEAAGYEFPDLPEGAEMTDEIKASREVWAQRFHELNIPTDTAKALSQLVNEDQAAYEARIVAEDKAHTEKTDAELKAKWTGEDYERNTKASERAITELASRAGIDVEELRHMELKNGRFLLDDPTIRQIFAPVGLEMLEGNLGPAMTDAERNNAQGSLETIRAGITKAQADGNTKEANRLYQDEQRLLAKLDGNAPAVGAKGRAA